MTDFITVAAYTNPVDASIGKSALEARGIAAYIRGEHTASMHLPGVDGVSGIELKVSAADFEAAKALLAPVEGQRIACPKCGSEDIRAAYGVLHALALELISRNPSEIASRRKCSHCGHKWQAENLQ